MNYKKLIRIAIGIAFCCYLTGCSSSQRITINQDLTVKTKLLYTENFDRDMDQWTVEQMEGGTVKLKDRKLDIDDFTGCTVWFMKKLSGAVMIEYDAVVVDQGGANDRVSDLNCFWMAQDPDNRNNFFASSADRHGKFQNYHALQLYYVGQGGHDNTKTRFRKYLGGGDRPVFPEHDLSDKKYMLKANVINKIRIIVFENYIQYYRNDQLIYDYYDENPYKEGYFGFRTYKNHMTIDNFRIYRLMH